MSLNKGDRGEYIHECASRIDKNITETAKALEKKAAEATELFQKYVRTVRERHGLEKKLQQLRASNAEEIEKIGQEYDKLVSLPKVQRVEVAGGVIKVFTNTLFCTDDRDNVEHELGEFRIEIYITGAKDGVRWFNLTRQVGGHHAPHVRGDGSACLGTAATGFAEFLASQEYAIVALYAINFVESANTSDDWGETISKWPVAKVLVQQTKEAAHA